MSGPVVHQHLIPEGGRARRAGADGTVGSRWHRGWQVGCLVLLLVMTAVGAGGATRRSSAAAFSLTSLAVTPSSNLVSDQTVDVRITGGSWGTTYAVVECDPTALVLLATGGSPEDGCDALHTDVVTVDTQGVAAGTLSVPAQLTTAAGNADCRSRHCFVAALAIHSTGGLRLVTKSLSFSSHACTPPGSCAIPADAWDPALGNALPATTVPPAGTAGAATTVLPATTGATATTGGSAATAATGSAPTTPITAVPGVATSTASVGHPATIDLVTGPAGSLSGAGTVTGPYSSPLGLAGQEAAPGPARPPSAGEGLLRLAMEGPGTSWGPGAPSSTVVDATVDNVTTGQVVGTQKFVLFWGASPFVYAGFAGPVSTADSYQVTITVEASAASKGLSQPAAGKVPTAVVVDEALEVVSPLNPQYLAYAYAPVMYGRSTSALHDVPLLTYADAAPTGAGATRLTYVVVWSHEDAGTGFLPFLEWGEWGRMADIETAMSLTVESDGTVTDARYLSGGESTTGYPDSQSASEEVYRPFAGTWSGHHPVLRDATGNNDFSDAGTTGFRFQLAPVAAPAPGQTREAVMDANPFTYEVMAEEIPRWYADIRTDPASPEAGEAQQYAIVDLDTRAKGVTSVAVGLQLSGSTHWYLSDQGWRYPLVGAGHVRTVVKLPLDWASRVVTGARVEVVPAAAAAGLRVVSLRVERFDPATIAVTPVGVPAAVVVAESLHVAAA